MPIATGFSVRCILIYSDLLMEVMWRVILNFVLRSGGRRGDAPRALVLEVNLLPLFSEDGRIKGKEEKM